MLKRWQWWIFGIARIFHESFSHLHISTSQVQKCVALNKKEFHLICEYKIYGNYEALHFKNYSEWKEFAEIIRKIVGILNLIMIVN